VNISAALEEVIDKKWTPEEELTHDGGKLCEGVEIVLVYAKNGIKKSGG
jgi:hypothetical protein